MLAIDRDRRLPWAFVSAKRFGISESMNAPSIRLHATELGSPASKSDMPGLNTVRALAALGVVMLHAGVPYLRNPMPGLQWSVQDSASTLVDCLFWAIEVFIMPVFLLLAGFFVWQTLQRKGQAVLLKGRAKRLLIPLLFGMLVVLPIDLYIWVAGWISDGLVSPVKLKSLKFDGAIGENIWGLSHLWFLLYLFLYVVVTATIATANNRSQRFAKIWSRVCSLPTSVLACTLVFGGACVLMVSPEVVWGFQHAFAPVPSKWLYSGSFFAGGILLSVCDPQLDLIKRSSTRLIPVAILFLAAAVVLGRWHLDGLSRPESVDRPSQASFARTTLALMTTSSAWLITLSLIGLSLKFVQRNCLAMQYLAAASFWVYLVHHPLLGLIHIDLKCLAPNLAPAIKMGLAFAISVGVSLLLYEAFIRTSALGRALGFAWEGPRKTPISSFDQPAVVQPETDGRRRAA